VDDSLQRSFGDEIAEGGEAMVYDHGTTLVKSIGLLLRPHLCLR
jgi:hypothetical protein